LAYWDTTALKRPVHAHSVRAFYLMLFQQEEFYRFTQLRIYQLQCVGHRRTSHL